MLEHTMLPGSPLGVYIHIPWCRALCSYCDFPVAVAGSRPIPHDEYLTAILHELTERAPAFAPGRRLVSIYLGGGTPSLWRPDCIQHAIAAVTETFAASPDHLEITLEANPIDCTADTMTAWRAAGVNRLSIGVQSVEPQTLITLGRDHRMGDGPRAVHAALTHGFPRISADIIFGTPTPDPRAHDASVTTLADTGVGHLSIYELTIEDRTALGRARRAGRFVPLDDDLLADRYEAIHHTLTARGYHHYEISSYARPGHRAVHNSLYWHGGEYLGLGMGAASFRRTPAGAERITNHRAVSRYLRARGKDRIAEHDILTPSQLAADLAWLGMRTADGVPAQTLGDPAVTWLLEDRLATRQDDRICPTLKGFLYADRIAARLVRDLA